MPNQIWTNQFREIYDHAVAQYRAGARDANSVFDQEQINFLAGIGLRPIFVYDHVEDSCGSDGPDFLTTLLIAAVRRRYFLIDQRGVWSDTPFESSTLPARKDEFEGVPWLLRILRKAQGFLEGNLPTDVMYFCGGDRRFLAKFHVHPADFLEAVQIFFGDPENVLKFLKHEQSDANDDK